MTIKKVVIPRSELPYKNAFIDDYLVRYRLISEDKNKSSHWSPVYRMSPSFYYVSKNVSASKQSNHVNIIWDAVRIKASENTDYYNTVDLIDVEKEYDVWIKWSKDGLGDWFFYSRIEGTSLSLNIPDEYYYENQLITDKPNELSLEIRQAANPIVRAETVRIFYSLTNESV
jgi:hypothetical protein